MPAAFFAALDQGLTTNADGSESGGGVVDDALAAVLDEVLEQLECLCGR